MKVVHIINSLDVGGAERFLSKLITYRHNQGNQDFIISLKKGGSIKSELVEKNIKIIELNLTWYNFIFKIFSISSTLKVEKPELIQTWLYHSDFIGSVLGLMLKIPVVWNIRQTKFVNPFSSLKTYLLMKWNARLSNHFVNKIITVSQAGKIYHVNQGYCSHKFSLLPNGFYQSTVEKFLPIEKTPFVIGMVGRYHSDKDYLTMFKALNLVIKSNQNFKLLLIGRGLEYSNIQLIKILNDFQILPFIELKGEVKNPFIYYPQMDLYCLTSINEGLPNALGEAMSIGVFPVTSNVGDAQKLVGDFGLLFEPGDYKKLSEILLDILNKPKIELYEKGQSAKLFIEQNFSIKSTFEKYQILYSNIIKECAV